MVSTKNVYLQSSSSNVSRSNWNRSKWTEDATVFGEEFACCLLVKISAVEKATTQRHSTEESPNPNRNSILFLLLYAWEILTSFSRKQNHSKRFLRFSFFCHLCCLCLKHPNDYFITEKKSVQSYVGLFLKARNKVYVLLRWVPFLRSACYAMKPACNACCYSKQVATTHMKHCTYYNFVWFCIDYVP